METFKITSDCLIKICGSLKRRGILKFFKGTYFIPIDFNMKPVDTGCKLNVHKAFRRRPGRLLNVLCTFNLRPVPTGKPLLISAFLC